MHRISGHPRAWLWASLILSSAPVHAGSSPGTEAFMQTMAQSLEKTRTSGFPRREVRFLSVQPAGESNGAYAFKASVLVHDYGPGFPKNGYFGETCVRKLNGTYKLVADGYGAWRIDGRLTSSMADDTCKKNPSEGVSSIPVESLGGTAAATTSVQSATQSTLPSASGANALAIGEWSCTGAGGRILVGLGFKVLSASTYTDLDGKERGTYSVANGVLRFTGGHLDEKTGHSRGGRTYRIGTVDCEPYR